MVQSSAPIGDFSSGFTESHEVTLFLLYSRHVTAGDTLLNMLSFKYIPRLLAMRSLRDFRDGKGGTGCTGASTLPVKSWTPACWIFWGVVGRRTQHLGSVNGITLPWTLWMRVLEHGFGIYS